MTEETTIIPRTFNNEPEAEMAKEKLEASSIYSFIENENTTGLPPLSSNALKIFLKDKEQAELVIAEDIIE
jgi:hypothetical protein